MAAGLSCEGQDIAAETIIEAVYVAGQRVKVGAEFLFGKAIDSYDLGIADDRFGTIEYSGR